MRLTSRDVRQREVVVEQTRLSPTHHLQPGSPEGVSVAQRVSQRIPEWVILDFLQGISSEVPEGGRGIPGHEFLGPVQADGVRVAAHVGGPGVLGRRAGEVAPQVAAAGGDGGEGGRPVGDHGPEVVVVVPVALALALARRLALALDTQALTASLQARAPDVHGRLPALVAGSGKGLRC